MNPRARACCWAVLCFSATVFIQCWGILQPGGAREELLAGQGSTCCLHLWRDFSGCRKQQGSKAASSKIKECDIPQNLTAWKAFLCPVLPFIFLSVSIWLLKLFLVWKPWSNLLLIKASISLFSVLSSWCSWAFVSWSLLVCALQMTANLSLASLSCVFKLHLDGTFNQTFLPFCCSARTHVMRVARKLVF